jgi:hypothetical protein
VPDGASLEGTELGRAHVAEIVAERVARIGRSAAVAKDVGITMEFSSEPFQIGREDGQRACR